MTQPFTFNFKKFNLSQIPDESVCVFIGKRKTGKSFCIRDLLYHKRNIPLCKVISGSEIANPFFKNFMPSTFIESEFYIEKVNKVLERQQDLLHKINTMSEYKNKDPRFLVLFDDCLHDTEWKKSSVIRNIFMNGRHYKIFFLLAMQYVFGIPATLRTNIDYVFIFRETSLQNRRKLYESFASAVPTFQMFCKLMDSLGKYECLVICNDADKTKLHEQIYWYKAVDNGPFKFGSKEMWNFHYEMLKRGNENEVNFLPHKRNAINININKYE